MLGCPTWQVNASKGLVVGQFEILRTRASEVHWL